MNKKIILTGGGTGGHVFPALAVYEHIKDKAAFYWLGSSTGMERTILESTDIPYLCIPAGKLRRYFSVHNFFDLFKIVAGFIKSLFWLIKIKPDLLFSKGGFVTVPPVLAARLLKIPVITHESDLDPGLATRINARSARSVCVPYEKSKEYFSPVYREKLLVTGNPVRKELLSGNGNRFTEEWNIPDDKQVLLVLGGSLGAKQINDLVLASKERLAGNYYIIHQTGETLPSESSESYRSIPFIREEMADILACADMALSRAGASSLWELAATDTAMLLLPLGLEGSRGDQIRNAELFREAGGAEILSDDNPDILVKILEEWTRDRSVPEGLVSGARQLIRNDSAEFIGKLILEGVF